MTIFHFYSPPSFSNCQNYTTLRCHSLHLLPLLLGTKDSPRTRPVSSNEHRAALSYLHTSRKVPFEAFLSFLSNSPKHDPNKAHTNSLPYKTYQKPLQVKWGFYFLVSTCLRLKCQSDTKVSLGFLHKYTTLQAESFADIGSET
jgi:hypothetical protein